VSWWIYFIQGAEDSPIKIGRAKHPIDRLKSLQSANWDELRLLAAFEGHAKDEVALHKKFERARGEWFMPSEGLLELIEEIGLPKSMRTLGE
jgi:hypothetical protein